MLVKRRAGSAQRSSLTSTLTAAANATGQMDRRSFLRNSGLAAGGMAALGALPLATVKKAEAGPVDPAIEVTRRKSICTHCSVGCTRHRPRSQNGVWVGQEPAFDSPINLGAHCAKGAAGARAGHGDRRLKYPMKLVDGKWTAARLGCRRSTRSAASCWRSARSAGPDSVYWLGSAKFTNEQRLPVPQVRGVLGHQHGRPSGAHLPLDDGRRCREHLGLRRDDQQLQRHP